MSLFGLAKNNEELAQHMKKHLDFVNSIGSFYRFFKISYRDSDYDANWVEFEHRSTAFDSNRYGSVHGGVIGMFLDTAMGLAAYEAGTGNSAPTMDLHMNFLKAIRPGDDLIIRATLMNAGKRTAVVKGEVLVDGEVRVIATSTCRIYSETRPDRPALAE